MKGACFVSFSRYKLGKVQSIVIYPITIDLSLFDVSNNNRFQITIAAEITHNDSSTIASEITHNALIYRYLMCQRTIDFK